MERIRSPPSRTRSSSRKRGWSKRSTPSLVGSSTSPAPSGPTAAAPPSSPSPVVPVPTLSVSSSLLTLSSGSSPDHGILRLMNRLKDIETRLDEVAHNTARPGSPSHEEAAKGTHESNQQPAKDQDTIQHILQLQDRLMVELKAFGRKLDTANVSPCPSPVLSLCLPRSKLIVNLGHLRANRSDPSRHSRRARPSRCNSSSARSPRSTRLPRAGSGGYGTAWVLLE